MPTPRELALQAAQSPGAYVPRSEQEAEQEFERLVRSGLSEDEAFSSITRRLTPESTGGAVVRHGMDALSQFGSNVAGALAGIPASLPGVSALTDAWGDLQATRDGGMDAARRRQVERGQALWNQTGGRLGRGDVAGAVRGVAELGGIPADRMEDAVAGGRWGELAGDAAFAGVLAKPGVLAKVPIAGRALPRLQQAANQVGKMGRTTAAPWEVRIAELDAAGKAHRAKLPQVFQQIEADTLLQKHLRRGESAFTAARMDEFLQKDAARSTVKERIGQQRVADVDRTVAQADAVRAREQQLAALNERLTRGQAAGIDRLRRNLGTAQDTRLGTQVARADGLRQQPPKSRYRVPDALQVASKLDERLRAQNADRSFAQRATGEGDHLRRAVAALTDATAAVETAKRAGTPAQLAIAERRLAAIQAQAAGLPLSILPLP